MADSLGTRFAYEVIEFLAAELRLRLSKTRYCGLSRGLAFNDFALVAGVARCAEMLSLSLDIIGRQIRK